TVPSGSRRPCGSDSGDAIATKSLNDDVEAVRYAFGRPRSALTYSPPFCTKLRTNDSALVSRTSSISSSRSSTPSVSAWALSVDGASGCSSSSSSRRFGLMCSCPAIIGPFVRSPVRHRSCPVPGPLSGTTLSPSILCRAGPPRRQRRHKFLGGRIAGEQFPDVCPIAAQRFEHRYALQRLMRRQVEHDRVPARRGDLAAVPGDALAAEIGARVLR